MIINQDYMKIMRAGKLSMQSVRKQNDSGMIVGICGIIAMTIICAAIVVVIK